MPNEMPMNQNTQEQLMLVQSFEQLAKAVGAEIPVAVQSEMAAVKNGMLMSPDLQKILAEGSMQLMDGLSPDQVGSVPQGTGTNPDIMKQPAQRMAPAQGMAPVPMPQAPSSEMTVPMPTTQGGPMNMQEMIDAGIIVPKRPMPRPTAPLQSRRPMTRPTQ
jgi:hypothetical protein